MRLNGGRRVGKTGTSGPRPGGRSALFRQQIIQPSEVNAILTGKSIGPKMSRPPFFHDFRFRKIDNIVINERVAINVGSGSYIVILY